MTPTQRGTLYMVLGMAAFAVEDALIKVVARHLPPGQILLMLGGGGGLLFGALAWARGLSPLSRQALHPAVLGRNAAEMVGTFGYVLAIAFSPLTTATAIFQAMPLAVTMGAALFLGERVGWRRWLAIAAGFGGVLIVVRPGAEGFVPASTFALLGVVGLAARDLFTRRVPPATDSVLLTAWGFAAVAVVGAAQLAVSGGAGAPSPIEWAWLGSALLVGAVGYWLLTESTRLAELSAIMPFRYSRLLFALLIGVVAFGERPDAWTLVGSAVIVGSGLYAFARERARARAEGRRGPQPRTPAEAGLPQGAGPG